MENSAEILPYLSNKTTSATPCGVLAERFLLYIDNRYIER
jgi:hypothetical protein